MSKRTLILTVVIIFLLSFLTPGHAAIASPAPAESVKGVPEPLAAEGIGAESWATMQAQMAAAQYHFTWQAPGAGEGAYRAPNPGLGLGVGFGPAGLQVWPLAKSADRFGLALNAMAGESAVIGGFSVDKGQVIRQGEGLTETLENDADGIRYALTVIGAEAETYAVSYQLSGDLVPQLHDGNLLVQDAGGKLVFQVGGLKAVDAGGQIYPAVFALEDSALTVQVHDLAGAQYPLTIQMDLWTQGVKLTADDAAADDVFGYSVAVWGDVVVVGAYGDDDLGDYAGAAYVFQRMQDGTDAWGQVTKLTASNGVAGDRFGISVGVSGDVIVVGAYETAAGGAAYVFQRMQDTPTPTADAWGEVAILTPSNPGAGNRFGTSVAVSGDVIVVGAKREDAPIHQAGAAYVFQRMQGGTDTWHEVARLTADDAAYDDRFGWSVAVSGDVIVVGAQRKSSDAGAAYVFHRPADGPDSWGQIAKLTASDAAAGDYFGTKVAASGDVIVVGAPGEDERGTDAGAAYVFQRMQGGTDTWGQVAKLSASDVAAGDGFGTSVAASGDVVVIGTWGDDDGGADAGAAYIFHRLQGGADGWGEVDKLTAADAGAGDQFGYSVAVSGDVIIVGARNEDTEGSNAGAAYIFQDDAESWEEKAKNTASDAAADDQFGYSVAVSGDVIVVGAPYEEENGTDAGAAYVFQRMQDTPTPTADAWGEVTKLIGLDVIGGDYFGISVAVSGDVIVVGAFQTGSGGGGVAYVFQRMKNNAWSQEAKLIPSITNTDYRFGCAVAVSGDVIVVGAKRDSDDHYRAGAAYVFQRMEGGADGWNQVTRLTAGDAAPDDRFGWSVAVSGDVIVVGAIKESSDAGAAYVFQRMQDGADAWGQAAKLTASDATAGDRFGSSVAASGDVIVVGAPGEDEHGTDAGAAYVFQRMQDTPTPTPDAWGEVTKLTAADVAEGDHFGNSVAVSGDAIVVGAWGDADGGANAGAAYLFQRTQTTPDGWGEVQKLVASDAQADDYFGYSTAISGDVVVISARYGDASASITDSGAAYIFQPNLPYADLSLIKTDDADPIHTGETLTYTLSISNAGQDPAENLTVTDTLPGGVTFQSATGTGWTCAEASGVVTCTRPNLAVGAAPDIAITITTPSTAGDITNSASITSETFDTDTNNNNDDEVTTVIYWKIYIPLVMR